MADQPTLLDDLAAAVLETDYAATVTLSAYHAEKCRELAARLRAAAARLREEMASPGLRMCDPRSVLERINAGPGPAPQAAPGTGMEPGQRCTLYAVHVEGPAPLNHEYDPRRAQLWSEEAVRPDTVMAGPRCPYIEPPAPVSVQEACESWCSWWLRDAGEAHSWHTLTLSFDDADRRSRAFCTPACRDAGKPLHPTKGRSE